ncbi:MAG: hypothetical protein DI570_15160 [Phenylobacterium zucineum]|nr:MAG: hypothetical protein DI570_15160 [Phenylobacterium zucineum]
MDTCGLRAARAHGPRPGAGYRKPRDVMEDPDLTTAERREILAAWLSDASAVQDQPHMRWLLGTPEPVASAEIRDALSRLDLQDGEGAWPC